MRRSEYVRGIGSHHLGVFVYRYSLLLFVLRLPKDRRETGHYNQCSYSKSLFMVGDWRVYPNIFGASLSYENNSLVVLTL